MVGQLGRYLTRKDGGYQPRTLIEDDRTYTPLDPLGNLLHSFGKPPEISKLNHRTNHAIFHSSARSEGINQKESGYHWFHTHTHSIDQEDWRHKTYCFNQDLAWFVDV